jgi:hypothetical protein
MKIKDVATGTLVLYTLVSSPLAGVGFLGYVLYTDKKLKNMEAQLKAAVLENNNDNSILTKDLKNVEIKGNVTNFEIQDDCIIENYQNRFYRIMKPSGEYLAKIFLSMEDAKKEIDIVAPFLKKPVRTRSRIYNIRYVR